jgi:hypothetical protein
MLKEDYSNILPDYELRVFLTNLFDSVPRSELKRALQDERLLCAKREKTLDPTSFDLNVSIARKFLQP